MLPTTTPTTPREPLPPTRRPSAFRAQKLGPAALALAVALASAGARADILPSGMKGVKATFELTGIEQHPDHLFVMFPFGACQMGESFFKLNPQHDTAVHNYEVLQAGKRYESQKFCSEAKIYAFKASEFKTEQLTLKESPDFYRPVGYTITVIKGFDELKTSEKAKFVAEDKRVKSSGFAPSYPLVVSDKAPFDSTNDVLRIAELSDAALRIEGVKVVLGSQGGPEKVVPYQAGQRPKDLENGAVVEPAVAVSPTSTAAPSSAANAATNSATPAPGASEPGSQGSMNLILAGVGALAVAGLGIALLSRSKANKKA
jgi:hypothetical protein